jgi:hypothetical protein
MILLGAVSVSSISNSRRYSRILLASVFKCAFDTIWYVVSIVAFSEISLSNTKLILQTTVCSVTDENYKLVVDHIVLEPAPRQPSVQEPLGRNYIRSLVFNVKQVHLRQ